MYYQLNVADIVNVGNITNIVMLSRRREEDVRHGSIIPHLIKKGLLDMGQKTINVRIDSDLHSLMKQEVVREDTTIAVFLENAIAEHLNLIKDGDDKWIRKGEA